MFNKKRDYFIKKLDGVQKMIWDMEFKRFKSLEIREDVRLTYDNLKAKIQMLDERMKVEDAKPKDDPTKLNKDERARLNDEKDIMTRDRDRYEAQMKQIDLDVHGSKPSADYPEGLSGLDDQLDSLQELKGMIKIYIKEL